MFVWFAVTLPFFLPAQYYTPSLLVPYIENAPEVVSRSAILMDAETGTVLFSKNSDLETPPASLTKLMTMHLLFNEVDAGRVSLDDLVPITEESWAQNQPPRSSLMFLAPGQIVTLREIMLGLVIPSGNDAAVAAALVLAPTVQDFVVLMNAEARRMGLRYTHFVEPSGISEDNTTTAFELALFCRQYVKLHPQSLAEFHTVQSFAYPKAANVREAFRANPRTIVQNNHNSLINTFPGVDGLKTGYIDEAGYNVALTALRDQTRFVAIILGAGSDRTRSADGTRLLSWAFDNFKTVRPDIGQIEKARLWKGKANTVELKLAQAADFTSPLDRADTLTFQSVFTGRLVAPLPAGFQAGHLVISDEQGEVNRIALVTASACEEGNVFKRIWHSIRLFFIKGRARAAALKKQR
ncbi:MAG: D-alanyl-D-alanine carboxypeptidase [Treponema sp.]|jgi:D-alanyl-D-alanine carboxypeptidase (penicillin-binding protein 5/6)|nr:D-alanyl-D-alanine carboxypeptidase [Treponema sp.]